MGRIVQVFPNLVWMEYATRVSAQLKEHIADIKPFHSPGKKRDVITADRSHVQNLAFPHLLKTFREKTKGVTGIAGKMRPRLGIAQQVLERGSQRSLRLIGFSTQDGRFLARIGGSFVAQLDRAYVFHL